MVFLPSVWRIKFIHHDKLLVTSNTLNLFFRSVSAADNKESILERSAGGAAVVHQGLVFGCLGVVSESIINRMN